MCLNFIGATKYIMLSALVYSKMPLQLTYTDLETFEEQPCSKKNIIMSQHKFVSRYEVESQTIVTL